MIRSEKKKIFFGRYPKCFRFFFKFFFWLSLCKLLTDNGSVLLLEIFLSVIKLSPTGIPAYWDYNHYVHYRPESGQSFSFKEIYLFKLYEGIKPNNQTVFQAAVFITEQWSALRRGLEMNHSRITEHYRVDFCMIETKWSACVFCWTSSVECSVVFEEKESIRSFLRAQNIKGL